MIRFLNFIRSLYLLNSRLAKEGKVQIEEKYSIESGMAGPERYDIYREGDKVAYLVTEFSWLNDVTVFTDSFRKWSKPFGESLSDFDLLRARKRIRRYFECWGGEVIFDDRPLPRTEDFIKGLDEAGIPYEMNEDGVIHYSVDIETERTRKGGFFDR